MRKASEILILIYTFVLLTSCGSTYRIQETEYNYIPYNGNEILIFESNKNDIDSIKLKEYKGWSRPSKYPYRLSSEKYEKYGFELIQSKSSNSNPDFIVEIFASNWKGLRIDIRAKSENTNYINQNRFTKQEFEEIPRHSMKLNGIEYVDVIIIEGNISSYPNDSQIIKFYWSEKNGLLGWNKESTEWRLLKKYVPQQRV
nr:hypothetical protein [uncultured Psychroserpens sp.]